MTQVGEGFYNFHWGRVFCGLIHIAVSNWLVWYENFLLKFICFVIFHQEPAILGRIRLPHAVSCSIHFGVDPCSCKVSIRRLDITPTAPVLSSARSLRRTSEDGLTVAFRNDFTQALGPCFALICSVVPLLLL